jgi:signal transduction histidine kinase
VEPRRRLIRWLAGGAQVVMAAVLGVLVVVDGAVLLSVSSSGYGVSDTLMPLSGFGVRDDMLVPLSGMVTVTCVLLRRRNLEVAVAIAVGCSLGVTMLGISASADLQPSLADLAGLAVLALAAARVPSSRTATVLLVAIGAAFVGNGVRGAAADLATLYLTAFVVVLAVGGYLRWLDWQRDQATATARRDERLDLARELHDLVAHYVTGIVVQAQAAQTVADQRPEAARTALADIEQAGTAALAAMRQLVGSLRSSLGSPLSLGGVSVSMPVPASVELPAGSTGLHDLVAQSNAAGLPARLRLHGADSEALPPAVAASVHRIVQESLTNVRRHGVEVTTVDVDLTRHADRVEIVVRDDGRAPVRPAYGAGFGLVGMAERTTALGGSLDVGPHPEGGWQVRACLPLRTPN